MQNTLVFKVRWVFGKSQISFLFNEVLPLHKVKYLIHVYFLNLGVISALQ